MRTPAPMWSAVHVRFDGRAGSSRGAGSEPDGDVAPSTRRTIGAEAPACIAQTFRRHHGSGDLEGLDEPDVDREAARTRRSKATSSTSAEADITDPPVADLRPRRAFLEGEEEDETPGPRGPRRRPEFVSCPGRGRGGDAGGVPTPFQVNPLRSC